MAPVLPRSEKFDTVQLLKAPDREWAAFSQILTKYWTLEIISGTDKYLGKQLNKISCQKPANIHSLTVPVTGFKPNNPGRSVCSITQISSFYCPGIPQIWHPPYSREIKRSDSQSQSISEHSEHDLDHGPISEDRSTSSSGRLEVQAIANKPQRLIVCNTPDLVVTHADTGQPNSFQVRNGATKSERCARYLAEERSMHCP